MTSKSLFSNLLKDDLKKRVWSISLFTLGLFIVMPLIIALQIGNDDPLDSSVYSDLFAYLGLTFSGISFIAIVCAVIAGLSSFHYLHSKKKVDLYHSLPIRREEQFLVNYIGGIIIFVVPYIVNLLITYIIIGVNGRFTGEIFVDSLGAFGINILFYILIYTLVSIASILTGHIVVAFLGSGVFLGYGALFFVLRESVIDKYFRSYSRLGETIDILVDITPIYNFATIFQGNRLTALEVIKIVIITIVLIAIAFVLFKKRPSEAAEKAMAFDISKPIIKIFLVIPVALIGGYLFSEMSYSHEVAWNIFGIIFVSVILSAILEMIYHFDVKAAFKGKKVLVSSLVVSIGVLLLFQYKVIELDKIVPAKSKIESMSIYISGLDENINYYEYDTDTKRYNYKRNEEAQLEAIEMKDFATIYELSELGIDFLDDYYGNDDYAHYDSYSDDFVNYTIKFKLSNGKEKYRTYFVPKDTALDNIAALYTREDYKLGHYPILSQDETNYQSIQITNMVNQSQFTLDNDQMSGFIKVFQKDLKNTTLDDIRTSQISNVVVFENYSYSNNYYILSCYTNTLDYLTSVGFKDFNTLYNVEDITQIEVYDYREKYVYRGDAVDGAIVEESKIIDSTDSYLFTDSEDIKLLMDSIIVSDYAWNNQTALSFDNYSNVNVTYKNQESGQSSVVSYVLKNDVYQMMKDMKAK